MNPPWQGMVVKYPKDLFQELYLMLSQISTKIVHLHGPPEKSVGAQHVTVKQEANSLWKFP